MGIAATVADLGTLYFLVESGLTSARVANLPSLLAGFCVQFLGNRYWVFRASEPPWLNQLSKFCLVEALSFGLNWLAFEQLITHTSLHYSLARMLSVAAVFFGFSYPLWKRIFHVPPFAETEIFASDKGGEEAADSTGR